MQENFWRYLACKCGLDSQFTDRLNHHTQVMTEHLTECFVNLQHTAESGFNMKEVSADKAYLGAENLLTTLRNGAIPYIPFKSNSVPHSRGSYGPKSTLWTRMFKFYLEHREEFLAHYHKRSNIETTFFMIKSKFGQRLRSKTLTAQINEALCKVLCHNLCVVIQSQHELGIDIDFSEADAA